MVDLSIAFCMFTRPGICRTDTSFAATSGTFLSFKCWAFSPEQNWQFFVEDPMDQKKNKRWFFGTPHSMISTFIFFQILMIFVPLWFHDISWLFLACPFTPATNHHRMLSGHGVDWWRQVDWHQCHSRPRQSGVTVERLASGWDIPKNGPSYSNPSKS